MTKMLSLIFTFCISIHCCFTEELDPYLLAVTEAMPCTLVEGCVSAISGQFYWKQDDIVIKGKEPICIPNTYISPASNKCQTVFNVDESIWTVQKHLTAQRNAYTWQEVSKVFEEGKCYDRTITHSCIYIDVYEANGGFVRYVVPDCETLYALPNYNEKIELVLWEDFFKKGITNCASGKIGGRNNLKNNKAFLKGTDHLEVHEASGAIRKYVFKGKNNIQGRYYLEWKKLSNGNKIWYSFEEYKGKEWKTCVLKEIKTTNPQGNKIYAWAKFSYPCFPSWQEPKKGHTLNYSIYTSDGQVFQYKHDHYRKLISKNERNDDPIFLLDSIQSAKYLETFSYHKDIKRTDPLLKSIALPDNRKLQIEYYLLGHKNQMEGCDIVFKGTWDKRFQKVRCLQAPVGENQQTYMTHQFIYDFPQNDEQGGKTIVFDVKRNKTIYYYNKNLRISKIVRYSRQKGCDKLENAEMFVWGKKNSPEESWLLAKSFLDEKERVMFSKRFFYDKQGNVIQEKIYGNISGKCEKPVQLSSEKLPKDNGVETYSIFRVYSSDGRNLLLEEKEDNGKVTSYSYKSGTDLLISKIIKDEPTIFTRQFYEYDQDLVLTKEIIDNGNTTDENAVVKITTILPRKEGPFIGMPDTIIESYKDEKNKKEQQLNKTVLHYSSKGEVIQKDIFDSENIFRYSLFYTYDDRGNLLSETNALGKEAKYNYDLNSNKTLSEDFAGRTTIFSYDCVNRLINEKQIYDGKIYSSEYKYDKANNKILDIDSQGRTTQYSYDAFGHVVIKKSPQIINTNGAVFSPIQIFTYDAAGREIQQIDENNATTKKKYNIYNKLTCISYPDGTQETYEYNLDGSLKRYINQNKVETIYTYDVLGRIISEITYGKDQQILQNDVYVYDGFNLLSRTDMEGNREVYHYDGAGRQKSFEYYDKENNLLNESKYFYDPLGRQTVEQRGQQLVYIKEMDLLGRIIEERQEDMQGKILSQIFYAYDDAGNRTQIIQEIDNKIAKTTFAYDDFDRLTKSTDPLGNITSIAYDDFCNCRYPFFVTKKTEITPLQHRNITHFDAYEQKFLVEKQNALGKKLSLEEKDYDPKGNLLQNKFYSFFPDNILSSFFVLNWQYDQMDRVEMFSEQTDEAIRTTRYLYTSRGLLKELIKPDGKNINYSYDELDRLIEIKASDCHYRYRYNSFGDIVEVKNMITHASTLYHRDGEGKILQEQQENGLKIENSYDLLGRRTELQLPDGSSIVYDFDPLFLRKVIRRNHCQQDLYCHSYTKYDLSENLLEEDLIYNLGQAKHVIDTANRNITVTSPWMTQTVQRDAIGKIAKIDLDNSFDHNKINYTYDDLGQIIQETGSINNNYTFDGFYNLKSKNHQVVTTGALHQISEENGCCYDMCGNLSKDNSDTQYYYDALDRLIEVVLPEQYRYCYTYDAFNRRMKLEEYIWRENDWVKQKGKNFLYDGQNEIGEADENYHIRAIRVLGNTPKAEIGAAVAIELDDKILCPIHDIFGNVLCLVDSSSQHPVESYHYSAFGKEKILNAEGKQIQESSVNNPWRYCSKRKDDKTGLIFFGGRYYHPIQERWITKDPKGYENSMNPYVFNNNNPLLYYDLYGLESWLPPWDEEKSFWENLREMDRGICHGLARFATETFTAVTYCLPSSYSYPMTVEGMMAFSRGDTWQKDFQESAISYMDRFMHTAMPVDRDSQVFQHFESRTNTAAHIGTFFIGGMGLIKGHLGVSTWKGWSLDADLLAIDGSLNSGFGKVKSAAKIENNLPNNHIWQKASPLKNRTAEELHEMFMKKDFDPKGTFSKDYGCYDSYIHPESQRQYYIDPKGKGRYRKPSHVDVFRHPDYKGSLKKKRFGYLDGN